MNIAFVRKYRKRPGLLNALLANNPVLMLGLDLPFIIVCATTLKNAVALSIEMFIIHMLTMVVAMVTVRKLPPLPRTLVNVGASFVLMTFARQLVSAIFPDIANYVGMYLYLMAVNGVTLYQSAKITRRDKAWPVLTSALINALAFTLVMLVVSLFREVFALGALWGIPLDLPFRLSGFAMPFGGFILMGFLMAFIKFLNKAMLACSLSEAARLNARYMEIQPK